MEMPHPDKEVLAAFLAGRLGASDHEGVLGHLGACVPCARRASGGADLREALHASSEDAVSASPAVLASMRSALPAVRPRRWVRAVAASLLAVAGLGTWILGRGGDPSPSPATRPSGEVPASVRTAGRCRLFSPSPDVECLVGARATVVRAGEGWELREGACLLLSRGIPVVLAAGPLSVRLEDGELLASREGASGGLSEILLPGALAGGPGGVRLLLLSGRGELRQGGERFRLASGEAVSLSGDGSLVRTRPSREELAELRARPFRPEGAAGAGVLDGRDERATRLEETPPGSYQAWGRFRLLDRGATLGLCFQVDGKPGFWVPEGAPFRDGNWHELEVRVSPGWVTLVLDGAVDRRVTREGFRPNAAFGGAGVGPAAWGGRAEVSAFSVGSLD